MGIQNTAGALDLSLNGRVKNKQPTNISKGKLICYPGTVIFEIPKLRSRNKKYCRNFDTVQNYLTKFFISPKRRKSIKVNGTVGTCLQTISNFFVCHTIRNQIFCSNLSNLWNNLFCNPRIWI